MSTKLMMGLDQARVGEPVRVYGMATVGTVVEVKGHGASYVVARGEHRFLVPGSAVNRAVDGYERGQEVICEAPWRAPPPLCRLARPITEWNMGEGNDKA